MSAVSIAILAVSVYLVEFLVGWLTGDDRDMTEMTAIGYSSAILAFLALLVLVGVKLGGAA